MLKDFRLSAYVNVLELQGSLFFGTAEKLLDYMRNLFQVRTPTNSLPYHENPAAESTLLASDSRGRVSGAAFPRAGAAGDACHHTRLGGA